MAVVERLRISKAIYKIVLYLIKVTPAWFASMTLLNTILSYFYIDLPELSFIASVSVTTLILLYALSVAFQFCAWHRIFIHYTAINWILNIYDYYIGIPLSNRNLFIMYLSITGICMFAALYFKLRNNEHRTQE